MTKTVSLVADLIDLLDPDLRYQFEERAGIIEFDGEQPRDFAECLALIDLLRSHPGALLGLTVLKVDCSDGTHFVLATDIEFARKRLAACDLASMHAVDPAQVVKVDFGGMALLTQIA